MAEESKTKTTRLINWLHENVKGDELKIVYIHDGEKATLGLSDPKSREVFIIGSNFSLSHLIKDNKDGKHYENMKHALHGLNE